jgi:hypothetical protein
VAKFERFDGRLRADHTWRSRPGYKIFVVDRGAVRFDIPDSWVVVADADGVRLHDKQPPDDECRLQVSVIRLPAGIDWTDLPLPGLLAQAIDGPDPGDHGTDREILGRDPVSQVLRPGLEIAWTETRWIDPKEKREARSRQLLARANNIQPLITLDFWADDAKRLDPAWKELVRSLRVGEFVSDPTAGPRKRR